MQVSVPVHVQLVETQMQPKIPTLQDGGPPGFGAPAALQAEMSAQAAKAKRARIIARW